MLFLKFQTLAVLLATAICFVNAGNTASSGATKQVKKVTYPTLPQQLDFSEEEIEQAEEATARELDIEQAREASAEERNLFYHQLECDRREEEKKKLKAQEEREKDIAALEKRIKKAKGRKKYLLRVELDILRTNVEKNGKSRMFGDFTCTHCSKHWSSGRAFEGYEQECTSCGDKTLPRTLTPLSRKRNTVDNKVPHPAHLCGRCIELGHSCTPSYDNY